MRRILLASAAAALAACTMSPAPPVAPHVERSAPSPRAECAPAQVTLYFAEQIASDEPVVTPLLDDFMERVRACQAAGGEVRAIRVAVSADPGQSSSEARAQVRRRFERVRAALVNAGAPADRIVETVAPAAPIMGRRAEIAAELW